MKCISIISLCETSCYVNSSLSFHQRSQWLANIGNMFFSFTRSAFGMDCFFTIVLCFSVILILIYTFKWTINLVFLRFKRFACLDISSNLWSWYSYVANIKKKEYKAWEWKKGRFKSKEGPIEVEKKSQAIEKKREKNGSHKNTTTTLWYGILTFEFMMTFIVYALLAWMVHWPRPYRSRVCMCVCLCACMACN